MTSGTTGSRLATIRPHDVDTETRAEFIAKIAKLYDVPKTLIRYVDTCSTDQAKACKA